MQNNEMGLPDDSISEYGKTALYYEYTSVDLNEKHAIEKSINDLLNDPDVPDENTRLVTCYLVQRFFIKTANDKKENIDLISQIPDAFKKMIDKLPPGKTEKQFLAKYFNIYLSHTMATQEDQTRLFETYATELKEFRHNLRSQASLQKERGIHSKEAVIEQIYTFLDSINPMINVKNRASKDKARKKIDQWIFRIFENHVIESPADVVVALEDYCAEEKDLSAKRLDFLKIFTKRNADRITKEILETPGIKTIKDGWPVISENIFLYIDSLTREHGDYRTFLEYIFKPVDPKFTDFFFNRFFIVSAIRKNHEKDIYLLEKTFRDLHLTAKYMNFFTGPVNQKIQQGQEKSYYIENYLGKLSDDIKGPHKNTMIYLSLRYLLEETLGRVRQIKSPKENIFLIYKKAFTDFIRPKYPKFLDGLIFTFLKESRELERRVGNTKKSYSDIYERNKSLLKDTLAVFGLEEDFKRTILPCITGFEQSTNILKKQT